MRQQVLWDAHARFMNALAAEGFVVLGGPMGEGGEETLLVIDSNSEATVRARLAADPWTQIGLLEIARVEPWVILLDSRPP
jgi:uncharacterized protein YciI